MTSSAPRRSAVIVLALAVIAATSGCAGMQMPDLSEIFAGSGALDEATVADGLREALTIGTERATEELAATGGFGMSDALRLALPEEITPLVDAMRRVGLGSWIDSLEDGINRAAEEAAAEARPIFAEAIRSMTITDAFGILRGEQDAATTYFREKTSAELETRFVGVVSRTMNEVGVYAQYQKLLDRYAMLPFAKPMPPSLESYVTQRTLDGLFSALAAEEAKIREDPVARTTDLLRKVFGQQG